MSYFGMPAELRSAVEAGLGVEIAEGLSQHWDLLVLSCMIFGIVTVISTLNSIYKRFRFNRPDYMEGWIPKIIGAVLMCNINWVVLAAVKMMT